jgi:hypothetical protein
MAGMTDLAIRIATTMDATGINKADKSVKGLDKTIKKLGRTLGVTLGASAMAAYGKAAVKAFAEDEAAARRLSSAVDNLGLSFSKVQVASFISGLEQSAAIADDVLRPAFQSLLNITGSLTKSQELLNNAIQISRASGVDLATVTADLGKGYVGITRGLIKYNTGLTRAELQTKSFNEILGIMLAKSAGAAQAYLTTTSYKLDVLRIASENAKEEIGKGLVDAFAVLGGGSQASDAAKTINNIAKGINAITMASAQAVNGLRMLYKGLDFVTSLGGLTGADGALVRRFDRPTTVSSGRSASPAGTAARLRQQRDAEVAAAKRAKEMAALTKKQVASTKALTSEQKKQVALKKAGTLFDMDQIQIIAALKGQVSDEERKRLELQFALLTGNEAEAKRLTYQIATAQGLGERLAAYLSSLPDAKNPFASWEAYLDMLALKARQVASLTVAAPIGTAAQAAASSTGLPSTNVPTYVGTPFGQAGSSVAAALGTPFGQAGGNGSGFIGTPFGQAGSTITLKITGEGDITNAIAKGLQNQSLSTGDSSYINRRTGGFAG